MSISLIVVLGVVIAIVIALVLWRRWWLKPNPNRLRHLGDLSAFVAQFKKEYEEEAKEVNAAQDQISFDALARVNALIQEHKYIQATQVIQESTGWSAERAKEAMERLRDAA